MFGQGPYRFASSFTHYFVLQDIWYIYGMAKEERNKKFVKFVKDTKPRPGKYVTSTDGKLKVLKTPGRGKKPNQIKRKKSERTTSKKLRKVCK